MATQNLTPPRLFDEHKRLKDVPGNTPIGINTAYASMALLNDVPHIAFCSSGRVMVKRLTTALQTPPVWEDLHAPLQFPDMQNMCSHTTLMNKNGKLVLAFIANHKIKVFRYTPGAIKWEDITPADFPAFKEPVIYLAACLDRNKLLDNLFLACITATTASAGDGTRGLPPSPPDMIHVFRCGNVTSVPKGQLHAQVLDGLKDMRANNISVTATDDCIYISFSNFTMDYINPGTPAPSGKMINDQARTNVMRFNWAPNKKGANTWTPYGYWSDHNAQKGLASAGEAFSEGPTFYNHIAAERLDHVYLGYRSGISMGQFGGGETSFYFSNRPPIFDNSPLPVPSDPNWHESIMVTKHWTDGTGKHTEGIGLPPSLRSVGNFATSAFDMDNNIYLAYSSDYAAGLTVFKFSNGVFKKMIECELNSFEENSNNCGGFNSYLSLAVDSVSKHIYITYIDYLGELYVRVTDLV